MKFISAVLFTTLYGLTVRLLFGFFDNLFSIMGLTFLMLSPLVIGFLTIILIPYKKIRTSKGAFFKPWITCLVLLVVTILFNVEGTICWIMIFPLFAVFAGLGGIIAYNIKKRRHQEDIEMDIDREDWEKPNTLQLSFLLLLPLIAGAWEGSRTLVPKEITITKQVVIAASTANVWQQLLTINTINSSKRHSSFTDVLGFPHHLLTTLNTPAVGGKRIATYEKGLCFTETITQYKPQQLMVLKVDTDPTTISPTVLDEHIVIGGKHVNILEDTYQLEPLADGTCRLSLSSRFYINTPFNWYAGIWANFLMSDILKSELDLVQRRVVCSSR